MTLDELKAEAKAQGYKLVKFQPYIRISPCPCGRKQIERWYYPGDGIFLKCPVCGRKGPLGRNEREARIKWNEEVQK